MSACGPGRTCGGPVPVQQVPRRVLEHKLGDGLTCIGLCRGHRRNRGEGTESHTHPRGREREVFLLYFHN